MMAKMAVFWVLLHIFMLSLLPGFHAWNSLTPPVGNSLSMKTKTLNGVQYYRCVDGDWLIDSSYATLVDIYDSKKVIGNYSWVHNPKVPRYIGTWSLFNDAGDHAESGFSMSEVQAKKIMTANPASPHDLPDFLALASKHEFDGEASMISYIARMNTKGGVPTNTGYCEWQQKVITVPFEAEFHMWKQDLVPPSTPSPITVESDRPVQGVFGKGVVWYTYNGSQWIQNDTIATLYDIPGGHKIGSFFIRDGVSNGVSSCWQFDDPNGFEIIGKNACNPVPVTQDCLPWSLSEITTSTRKSAMFGDYSFVQMVSTTGGMPSNRKPKKGKVYRSRFTAIYWLYCKEKP